MSILLRPHFRLTCPPAALALALMCCVVELVLLAADHGVVGSPYWRSLCYQYAGFWAGLLFDWQPNYRAQPVVMFFSYAFLHGGLSHLVGNMVSLVLLSHLLGRALSGRAFGLLLIVSSLGGAAAFGLLSQNPAPMVGASGAVFGLAGALLVVNHGERRLQNLPTHSLALLTGFLAANVLFWWWNDGWLAWEAHLGGFLAGAGLTLYRGPIRVKIRS